MTIQPELPNSIEAEMSTLGSILLNRDAITAVADWLTPDMFYLARHALIYAAMLACYKRRVPPDIRLVAEELREYGKLEAAGGITALSELVDSVPTSYHIEHYAEVVRKTSVRRRLIEAGGKIAALGYDTKREFDALIADAQALLTQATGRSRRRKPTPISAVVDRFYEQVSNGVVPGQLTGFRDYDALTGGVHKGDLIILAARPSVGKTSLALAIVEAIAQQLAGTGQQVGVFSLEMEEEQLNQRLISMLSGVDLMKIRHGRMSDDELRIVMETAGIVHSRPIWIEDQSSLRIDEIRTIALRQAMENEPALIVVDYLQLMSGRRTDNRVQEVSEISRGLKQLARELGVPILALSQLSRAVEQRQDKRPMLSDLRDSGTIEQDADQVLFIYRDELYNKDTKAKGVAELIIAKHRNGAVGTIPLRFDAATTRFSTLTYRDFTGY